ncbi:hypothetical protein GQ53DRAFT_774903 [Thozetella sp. PMI_491]|nr:hypothetical protein GQ53DRAFT_774903 [Thozetella sp. PMI_491]
MDPSQTDPNPRAEDRASVSSKFVCSVCHRGFARREHLMRHERIHTNEAPFGCEGCGQRFRRQDVFRRHLTGPCAASRQALEKGRQRASRACNQCRVQKLKCDGNVPCRRCAAKSRQCVFGSALDRQPSPEEMHGGLPLGEEATSSTAATGSDRTRRQQSASPDPRESVSREEHGSAMALDDEDSLPQQQSRLSFPSPLESDPLPPVSMAHFLQPNQQALGPWDASHLGAVLDLPDASYDLALDFALWANPTENYYPFSLTLDSENDFSVATDTQGLPYSPDNPQFPAESQAGSRASPAPGAPGLGYRTPNRGGLPQWLHQLPPNIQSHDTHIVQAFLEEFLANMDAIFPTFSASTVSLNTLPDLILAMAAVGGLFSKVEGSFRVAMSLYTDARRLATGRVWSEDALSKGQYIDLIRAV